MLLRTGFHTNAAVLVAAVVPDPWTPAELDGAILRSWWDASDTATITESSGLVSQWNDKGVGNNLVSTSGDRPTTGAATQNGLNVLTFTGSDKIGKDPLPTALPDNTPGITVLIVVDTVNENSVIFFSVFDNFGPVDGPKLRRTSSNTFLWSGRDEGNSASATATTNWTLISMTATTTLREIFLGGASAGTNTSTEAASQLPVFFVGATIGGGGPMTGAIGELIFLAGELTTERQLCEGYLAWKWGLVADLDSGHPYKSAAPTV